MFALLLLFAGLCQAQSTYVFGSAKLLDADATALTVTDSAGSGVSVSLGYAPTGSERVKVWFFRGFRDVYDSTATCTNPCTVSLNLSRGDICEYYEYVDASGNALSPRKLSACRVLKGVYPAPSATIPVPTKLIGSNGKEVSFSFPVAAGTSTSDRRLYFRAHNLTCDGKASFRLNSGAWIDMSNANTPQIDTRGLRQGIGYPMGLIAEFAGAIPDGLITADATNTITFRLNKTCELSLGLRLLSFNILEANKTVTQIVVTGGNLATATTDGAHNFTTGDYAQIVNAPGMWLRFNGLRQITVTGSTTFTFTPTNDPGAASVPNGTYVVPTARATNVSTQWPNILYQPVMTAARAIIPATSFVADNPAVDALYQPYTADSARIAAGQAIWEATTNKVADSRQGHTRPVGCAECHTPTPYGEKYFNFSRQELELAAERTGNSEQGARDLVDYVYSLAFTAPTYTRPYTPLFQKGPGVASKPQLEWTAGCGWECALNYDRDMDEYLRPAGSSATWRFDSLLNQRDIPDPIIMLPWNNWIVPVHPRQLDPNFYSSSPWTAYTTARAGITQGNCSTAVSQFFNPATTYDFRYFLMVDWKRDTFNYLWESKNYGPTLNTDVPTRFYSMGLWTGLKYWEIMQTNALWTCATQTYPSLVQGDAWPDTSTYGYLPRGGYRVAYSAFNIAPHKNTTTIASPMADPPVAGSQLSTIWYLLGVTIDPGNRRTRGDNPIDWPYHWAFLRDNRAAGPFTMVRDAIWAMQASADHPTLTDGESTPTWMWFFPTIFNEYVSNLTEDADYQKIVPAFLHDALLPFLARFSTGAWSTKLACNAIDLSLLPNQLGDVCDSLAYALPVFKHFGATSGDLDTLQAFGEALVPGYNWAARRATTCAWSSGTLTCN